jgi:hypothetical protein
MALSQRITTSGLSAVNAQAIQGTVANGLTATGNSQATALALSADINYVTTVAASTGVILPPMNPGDSINIYNKGANTLAVYPPVGGAINSVATNGAYNVATTTPYAELYCITPLIYIASQSA